MQKTILCFGDSNTHGYNAENNGRFNTNERWTCLLKKNLGDNFLVIEEGLSGRTTVFEDPLYESLSSLPFISPCLTSHEPIDLIIIMLGTNDVKERFSVDAPQIARGMRRLLRKVLTTENIWANTPNILLVSPLSIDARYRDTAIGDMMGNHCDLKSKKLAHYYQEIAKELGCHFLDADTVPHIALTPIDYMHLSREGHQALATYLSTLIPTLL